MSKPYTYYLSCQIGFEEMVKTELLNVLLIDHPLTADQATSKFPKQFSFSSKQEQNAVYQQLIEEYSIKVRVGGVEAKLPLKHAYNFMLWSRQASRVLLVLDNNYCGNDFDLYNIIYSQNWAELLHPGFEFKVNFNGTSPELKNTKYSSLRVKDAIVDYYQNRGESRPNVNTDEPDVIIDCRLHKERLQLALDLSGTLHKRYRSRAGFAPMRETLAANLILRTGWDKSSPVYNPMCGSGVLAIEAAMIALNIAPGLYHQSTHLDFWKGHDIDLWISQTNYAKQSKLSLDEVPGFKVYASDNDHPVLTVAKINAELVDVLEAIEFTHCEFKDLQRNEHSTHGLVIINPPYGVRLANERQLYNTYYTIGEVLKFSFPGWIAGVISSSEKLLKCISLSPNKKWEVKNSNLDCQFRLYAIRAERSQLAQLAAVSQTQESTTETTKADTLTTTQTNNGAVEQESTLKQDEGTTVNSRANEPLALDNEAQDFYNRLVKNAKRLNSYLKRKQVQNYRLYDADIPTFNVAVDVYTDAKTQQQYFVVQEYVAAKDVPMHKAVKRSLQALVMVQRYAESLKSTHAAPAIVIDKLRERQSGSKQYEKIANEELEFWVEEYGCKFKVNLTDYIDTGIFLDNRDLRYYLRSHVVAGKTSFLNLFSYTSTATVHAIKAGAKFTTSVDMSNSYCQWSAENIKANSQFKVKGNENYIIQSDVLSWIDETVSDGELSFDLIFCDPPTFSNSKRMQTTWDVQRDHLALLTKVRQLLNPEGKLVFCNNKRGFKLDKAGLEALGFKIEDITAKTMPEDFKKSKIHQAWLLSL